MNNSPRRIEHQVTERGYIPVYARAVIDQPWSSYSPVDHHVWDTLIKR